MCKRCVLTLNFNPVSDFPSLLRMCLYDGKKIKIVVVVCNKELMADGSLGEPSCWQDIHGCSMSERLLGQNIMLVKRARVKLFLPNV